MKNRLNALVIAFNRLCVRNLEVTNLPKDDSSIGNIGLVVWRCYTYNDYGDFLCLSFSDFMPKKVYTVVLHKTINYHI